MKPETTPSPWARATRAARLAIAFLTVIPLRAPDDDRTEQSLEESRFFYPLVGLAIGLLLAALSESLRRLGAAPGPSAFLLVLAGVGISGALHLDGLADTCDGLFLSGDRERRLSVMRDPHVGSFGVVAIVLVLLGKFAALEQLGGHDRALAILGTAAIGRLSILISAGSARYAREDGTGRILIDATSRRDALASSVAVLAVAFGVAGRAGLVGGAACLVIAWGGTRIAASRLGGVTGDILGALVELGEVDLPAVTHFDTTFGATEGSIVWSNPNTGPVAGRTRSIATTRLCGRIASSPTAIRTDNSGMSVVVR